VLSLALLVAVKGPVFQTSAVDVTPDELLPLGGYTSRGDKPMEPGGERLYARTLVLGDGTTQVAIVSFEALTVPESLYKAVKSKLPESVRLFLVATHTHAAPDSQMLNDRMTFKVPGIASFQRRWLEWTSERIAEGVKTALASPATDALGLGYVVGEVDANRGRREGAVPIKTAGYILHDGKPLLTTFAAHGTLFDETRMKTHGDWPGSVSRELGGLVLPGAIGDVSPVAPHEGTVDNLRNLVEKLRSGYANARVKDLFSTTPEVSYVEEEITLEKPVPHPEFAKAFGAPDALAQVLIQRFAPTSAMVSIVQAGAVLFVGIPGEPTSEIGRKVQLLASSIGFPHSFVVSHTNGWIGYVLTPGDYDRGGYEATLSFHGRGTSERVLAAVERGLRKLQAPRVAHTR
jgi:hypothetical protein